MTEERQTTYEFRITCLLARGAFESKERRLTLTLDGCPRPITVMLPDQGRPQDRSIIFKCGGFKTVAEARATATPLKTAVMLAAIVIGVGIDVGNDEPFADVSWTLDGKRDDRIQQIVHGIQVIPEIKHLHFASLQIGDAITRIRSEDLQKHVNAAHALGRPLTKKQTIASQLYSQSHFQSSEIARFLLLVSAVEALVEPTRASDAATAVINGAIKRAEGVAQLSTTERKTLVNRLGYLKQESIGSSCRSLVEVYCGMKAARGFNRAYNIRSRLLHKGELSKQTKLSETIRALDFTVRQLITRHVCGVNGKKKQKP